MSYVRWGEANSDVYVYHSIGDVLHCCGCFVSATYSGMIAHLRDHQSKGDCVPDEAIAAIEADGVELGDRVTEVVGRHA